MAGKRKATGKEAREPDPTAQKRKRLASLNDSLGVPCPRRLATAPAVGSASSKFTFLLDLPVRQALQPRSSKSTTFLLDPPVLQSLQLRAANPVSGARHRQVRMSAYARKVELKSDRCESETYRDRK